MNKKKAILLADQMVFSGTAFLLTIGLSRFLSLQNFGLFASLVIVMYLILSVSHAVIVQPMQIFIEKIENKAAYKSVLLTLLLGLLGLILLIGGIIKVLDFKVFSDYTNFYTPFLLYANIFIVHDLFRKYFLAQDQLAETLVLDTLSSLGQITAIFTTIFYFTTTDLAVLFVLLALSYLPSLFYGFYVFF